MINSFVFCCLYLLFYLLKPFINIGNFFCLKERELYPDFNNFIPNMEAREDCEMRPVDGLCTLSYLVVISLLFVYILYLRLKEVPSKIILHSTFSQLY